MRIIEENGRVIECSAEEYKKIFLKEEIVDEEKKKHPQIKRYLKYDYSNFDAEKVKELALKMNLRKVSKKTGYTVKQLESFFTRLGGVKKWRLKNNCSKSVKKKEKSKKTSRRQFVHCKALHYVRIYGDSYEKARARAAIEYDNKYKNNVISILPLFTGKDSSIVKGLIERLLNGESISLLDIRDTYGDEDIEETFKELILYLKNNKEIICNEFKLKDYKVSFGLHTITLKNIRS